MLALKQVFVNMSAIFLACHNQMYILQVCQNNNILGLLMTKSHSSLNLYDLCYTLLVGGPEEHYQAEIGQSYINIESISYECVV